jgi:hypothetical protein
VSETGIVAVQPELLAQEPPPRAPRWVWVGLAVVLLVGAAAWAVDEYRRGREDAALTACRSQLRDADERASERLIRVADYLRPSLASLPPEQARRLAEPMTSPARLAIPVVRAAVSTCHGVRVWSWHEPSHARREATVAFADELLGRLERIATEGGTYFDSDPRLDRLRARADLS